MKDFDMKNFAKIIPVVTMLAITSSCGLYYKSRDNKSPSAATNNPIGQSLQAEDLSVNNASVTKQTTLLGDEVLLLDVDPGNSAPGSFNGGGTGSKAILGINNFNNMNLAELESIQYTERSYSDQAIASILYINIQVDLYCDGSEVKILTADPEFTSQPIAVDAEGFETYRVEDSDNQFRAVGGLNSQDGNTVIASPNNPGTGRLASLDEISAEYPDACIVKTATGDGGMPKSPTETSGFLFVVGSSSTNYNTGAEIKEIKFNDEVYKF
jgi:hypothetical protein